MGLLNVPLSEWAVAEEFFRLNDHETKLKKSSKERGFSFINVEGKLYAMANGTYLGEGGFAKVKVVENRQGDNFAVKIEGKGIDHRTLKEIDVMKRLGKHIGILERNLDKTKPFWKPASGKSLLTNKKIYKILPLEHGKDLFDLLHNNPSTPLTTIQKLIIAIRSCQVLKEIHRQGVIHADIKPDNMLVTVNGNQIALTILDFGFSILLPEGQTTIRDELKGTLGFIAPEIYDPENKSLSKGEFSYASDVYALGMMFKDHFRFTENFYGTMIAADPVVRPTLDDAILKFVDALALQRDLDVEAINLIKTYKPDFNVVQKRPLPPIPTPQPSPANDYIPTRQAGQFFKAKLELLLSKAPQGPAKPTKVNQLLQEESNAASSSTIPSQAVRQAGVHVLPSEGLTITLRKPGSIRMAKKQTITQTTTASLADIPVVKAPSITPLAKARFGQHPMMPAGIASAFNSELNQRLQTRPKPMFV